MSIKESKGEKIFNIFNIFFLTIVMIIALYPLLYVFYASISDPVEIMKHRGLLLYPLGFSIGSYKLVFQNPMIGIGYRNTLFYVLSGTLLSVIFTAFGAYALSRKQLYIKKAIMFMIVFTMFFSGGIIPTYLLVKGLGMRNTVWAIIIPDVISAWNLIIMRTYFLSIPDSFEESAKIDGANDFTILFKIILPLAMPVVAVIILYYGVAHWNAWFKAMIYLQDRSLFPLQLVLREILIANSTDSMTTSAGMSDKEQIGETVKYATIIVATLPILTVYPFLQKYFVKGVMIGGIKE